MDLLDLGTLVVVGIVGLLTAVWYFFFRVDSNTKSSFNPTPQTSTVFKSVNVATAPKKPAAPQISRKQKAKDENKPYVPVLFGSQTGTAEDFGEQLVQEMESYGIVGELLDMEDCEGEQLQEWPIAIFVVATYGEGEPTDNAKELWKWLTEEAQEGNLKTLKYGVFGLGNKTYEHYNWMGRQLTKRLKELGATEVLTYGEGDDDATLEDDFSAWKSSIWQPLCTLLGVKQELSMFETGAGGRAWKWRVAWDDKPQDGRLNRFDGRVDNKKRVFDKDHPFLTDVENCRELTAPGNDRGCLHVDIKLPKNARYEEGDHIGVYPLNSPQLVADYCAYFGYDSQRVCCIYGNTDKDRDKLLFGPLSVETILSLLVDLQEVPRKSTLERLSSYAENPDELKHFTDKTVYADVVEKRYMTVLEILQSLRAPLKVPFQELVQILPPLQPRYYSISSSLRFLNPRHIASITCARVDNVSPTGRVHAGVASHWLYAVQREKEKQPEVALARPVAAFIRSSQFRMPLAGRPAIMIGPGTGIAPFMGFLQRRVADKAKCGDVLFTGFRNRNEYYYHRDLEQWAADGFVELHVAFSREGPEKHYVQHDVEKNQDRVWDLIEQKKANIYICGDANRMEKDVIATLLRIIKAKKGGDDAAAQKYMEKMVSDKRIQKDTWQ